MAIENVTVNMAVQKITFDNNLELYELCDQLMTAGWFGGMSNGQTITGEPTPRKVQLTSPEGHALIYDLTTTVAVVNGAHVAMTADEFQSRYGAGQ